MTELTLTFTQIPRAELIETRFEHPRLGRKLVARLGAYDQSFKWTAGVQALSTLLLQTAVWHRRSQLAQSELPCLEGCRPSAAASLNDALTSKPQWTCDMFGQVGGRPFLGHLIKRWNADFNTSPKAPVRLWLEPAELPPEQIRVCVNGRTLEEPGDLWALAEDVERQWGGKVKSVAQSATASPIPDTPVGVRLNVSENRVLIELVLDRPFESFGPNDEEDLLRAIRALLKTSRELPIRGKRPGSVILTLELTQEEAKELAASVTNGALAEFGATTVRDVASPEQHVSSTVSLEVGQDSPPKGGNALTILSPLVLDRNPWWRYPMVSRRIVSGAALLTAAGGLSFAVLTHEQQVPTQHLPAPESKFERGIGFLRGDESRDVSERVGRDLYRPQVQIPTIKGNQPRWWDGPNTVEILPDPISIITSPVAGSVVTTKELAVEVTTNRLDLPHIITVRVPSTGAIVHTIRIDAPRGVNFSTTIPFGDLPSGCTYEIRVAVNSLSATKINSVLVTK